ncbi:MAG: ABC transporter permease subunit [Thermoplasmata archaeon]|jgi:peptide/nickel transport system permease protein|nr:ABC transporter permease subunit [Thermoplasmata archaeon]
MRGNDTSDYTEERSSLRPRKALRGKKAILVVGLIALLFSLGLASSVIHRDPHPDAAVGTEALQNEITAVAGWDRLVGCGKSKTLNNTIILDGKNSTAPEGIDPARLIYSWTFMENGFLRTLNGKAPTYVWRYVGVYNVTLNVSDYEGNSDTDLVVVTVVPYAYAGGDKIIYLGTDDTLQVLNGTQSLSNLGITNYTWTFNYSGVQYTAYTPLVEFNFERAGKYLIQLKVTDAGGNVGYNNATITVKEPPTFLELHWLALITWPPIGLIATLWVVNKYKRDKALVTSTDKEKARLQWKSFRKNWKIFRSNRLGFTGLIVLVVFAMLAVLAPVISTVPNPTDTDFAEPNIGMQQNPLPPSFSPSVYTNLTHPWGTDSVGQDVYSMTMYGTRASLIVGLVATLISVIVGTVIGLAAGYFGKLADEVLMRTTDFFLVLPWFPLMIVMMAILGQKFIWVVVVIGITSWPSTARVVRSQVLTLKERQFIVRAKCVAAGDAHIIKTHIMPNVLPLIFANTVLLIAVAIFSESFLDFFGLGDPSVISWGSMLELAYDNDAFLTGAWWWIAAPGGAIVLLVLSFSLVGYAIDDVLNPKLRRR